MSTKLPSSTELINAVERKSELDTLDPVLEVNETIASEIFDRLCEVGEYEEISPRIFGLKTVLEPLTIESLKNAIYEIGVVNLCWPEITEPVFETRTCFPTSYYTNCNKERLLLAYAENFRQQFQMHFQYRKPLLLQAPNECGLQKMVCTSIRPTKLCFADTNTWQGVADLVADYFQYEPLTKPMLHVAVYTKTNLNRFEKARSSRYKHRLKEASRSLIKSQHTVRVLGPIVFSKLPTRILDATSIGAFKSGLNLGSLSKVSTVFRNLYYTKIYVDNFFQTYD